MRETDLKPALDRELVAALVKKLAISEIMERIGDDGVALPKSIYIAAHGTAIRFIEELIVRGHYEEAHGPD